MVKIVCTSDTHSKHKQVPIPDGDIFIHAGDLTPRGNHNEFISVGNWFRSLKDRFKHRIFIAGNHDFGLEFNKRIILMDYFDNDVIYLQDSEVVIDGIKFYGSPWTPEFYNWAFMREDADLAPCWAAIPDDVNVLITHGPPFNILDRNTEDERIGSKTLYERVKQLKHLKHHIFGHAHGAYGSVKIDDIEFHNVAALNESYRYQNPPQVIEL